MRFKLIPMEEIPKIKRHKRSKYDPIIEAFIKSGHKIAKVAVEGIKTNQLALGLKRRLRSLGIDHIKVEIINYEVYLERI